MSAPILTHLQAAWDELNTARGVLDLDSRTASDLDHIGSRIADLAERFGGLL